MRALVLVVAAAVVASGCATKKYVTREVGEVNQKVDALSTEVEKTQERVRTNETRIESVSQDAHTGIGEAKGAAAQAMSKAEAAEAKALGKLVYSVTLSNDKVTFPRNRAVLSDEARAMVDQAMTDVKALGRPVYFEIEGHTDATGEEAYNEKLGYDRAQAVRNYLHDQHGLALNRIEVISYGELKPVADNKTREGRAQNRRVVIRVLE